MSVPWIVNRKTKFEEKVEKYKSAIQTLKVDNPLYNIQQITFIVDCLGGYSKSFIDALKIMEFDKWEIEKMCLDIQKILITEATSTINKFKVLTMSKNDFLYSIVSSIGLGIWLKVLYYMPSRILQKYLYI